MKRVEVWLYNEVTAILAQVSEAVVYQTVLGKYVVEYYI